MKPFMEITWPPTLQDKMAALLAELKRLDSVLVAFSGGVDSTFLTAVAAQALGPRVLAVTAISPVVPQREVDEACRLAADFGVAHRIIASQEMENPEFVANPANRCYYCKSELFGKLKDIATREGFQAVLDGSNRDDAGDYRPGRQAACESGVHSPLLELGFTKEDIRAASRLMGLATADKPAMACLASRFPYGTEINAERLQAVGDAEAGLRDLGFRVVRVRLHGDLARVELSPADLPRATAEPMRGQIASLLRRCGFLYATLDLEGYQTGSMNRTLGAKAAP